MSNCQYGLFSLECGLALTHWSWSLFDLSHTLLSLLILIVLELVLGVDNLVFITITSQRLPEAQQSLARRLGLTVAVVSRLVLLAFAFWLVKLIQPIFHIGDHGVSIRDLILFFGGVFLIYTAVKELWVDVRGDHLSVAVGGASRSFLGVIIKIMLFDILFSLDSVITAVGVANEYWVMALAIIIAVIGMIILSDKLAYLIKHFWRIRLLALCFLVLVGLMLIFHGLEIEFAKSYIYVALFFSIFVEVINSLYEKVRARRQKDTV